MRTPISVYKKDTPQTYVLTYVYLPLNVIIMISFDIIIIIIKDRDRKGQLYKRLVENS